MPVTEYLNKKPLWRNTGYDVAAHNKCNNPQRYNRKPDDERVDKEKELKSGQEELVI